jgi:hypothetical protein
MEHVWNHTFYDRLRVDPKECNILLTGVGGDTHTQPHRSRAHTLCIGMTHDCPPQTRR